MYQVNCAIRMLYFNTYYNVLSIYLTYLFLYHVEVRQLKHNIVLHGTYIQSDSLRWISIL